MQGRTQAMTDTRVCSVEPKHVKCNQTHLSQTGFKRASHAPVVYHVIRPARILLVVEMHVVITWLHEARDNNKLQSAQEIRCTFLSWLQVTRRNKDFLSYTGKRIFFEKDFFIWYSKHICFLCYGRASLAFFVGMQKMRKKKKKKKSEQLGNPFPPAKFAIWCFLKPAWAKKHKGKQQNTGRSKTRVRYSSLSSNFEFFLSVFSCSGRLGSACVCGRHKYVRGSNVQMLTIGC